jgi:hypothetical protein
VKEQRGPFGRIADSVSGSLRRRQQIREPRAIVFDAEGHPRVVPGGTREHAALMEAAEQLVRLSARGRGGDEAAEDGDDAPADGDAAA